MSNGYCVVINWASKFSLIMPANLTLLVKIDTVMLLLFTCTQLGVTLLSSNTLIKNLAFWELENGLISIIVKLFEPNWILYELFNTKLGSGNVHCSELSEYLGQMQVVRSYLFERGIEWSLLAKFKVTSKKVIAYNLTFKINICQSQICIIKEITIYIRAFKYISSFRIIC